MVHPGERLYALLLRTNGKHTMFLNYLYYVSDTGFEEVWFSDMDDQIGVLTEHIDTKGVIGIDKTFPARFLIPLQERCPELKTVWGSDCVDGVRAVKNEEEIKIMRQASVINDMVMERAAAYIKEGMTENRLLISLKQNTTKKAQQDSALIQSYASVLTLLTNITHQARQEL